MAQRSSKLRRLEETLDVLNHIVNDLVKENYELKQLLKQEVNRGNSMQQTPYSWKTTSQNS